MRLILIGPPGSGKGTQAKRLCVRHAMAHISTGDILRDAIAKQSPLGRQAEPLINQGKLVPDTLVNDLVADRFRRADRPANFLMDGYPRTLPQAQAFNALLQELGLGVDAVVLLDVPDDEIVKRISGRRVAPASGAVYHIQFKPPKVEGRCDISGEPLVQRPDDKEETIRERLKVYRTNTLPLLDFYRGRGLLRTVDGTGSVDAVAEALSKVLPGV